MRNIQELINKINNKEKLNYSVYLNIGENDSFINVSNYVYDIIIDYTDLKFDFTPSTTTARVKIYGHKNQAIINEIKTKISQKKLKIKIYIDLSENQKLKIFEGYIEYPTFKQIRTGFNKHDIEAEFFDYSYILKTKKIGTTKVISGIAQGGSKSTIILSNNASEINDFYNGLTIQIERDKKIEEKVIVDYVGATKTAYLDSELSFEVISGCPFVIKKRLTYLNCKKVDNSNKDKSLLHQIMYQAGFNDSYIQVDDILVEVPVVVFSKEISCFEAIRNLFQSEIMIFDFSTGILRAKSIDFSTISPIWTINNTLQAPNNIYTITETIENNKMSYKSIRAEYNDIKYDDEKKYLYIFKEKDSNWKNSDIGIRHNAYKYIQGGKYLPEEGYYSGELKYGEDCDIVYVNDIEVELKTYEGINGTPKIILSDLTIDLNKIDFRFYNNTSSGDILLEFKLKGKAYYIKATDVIVEGNTLEGDVIEIKDNNFFADITQVRKLVNFYNHILINLNNYTYTLKCNNLIHLEIGDIIYCKLKCGDEFIGLITGIKQKIDIFEPEETELTIIPVSQWIYNPDNQRRNTINNSLYTINANYLIEYIQENNNLIEQNVNETIEEAFQELANGTLNEFGWTTTPEKINFTKISVDKWAITLTIQKQRNLSNFKQYELQVSEDGIYWYDFEFNQLNGITTTNIETITFIGDVIRNGNEILGKGYYFRVRQRTLNNIVSEWSDVAMATTIPFGQDERSAVLFVDVNNFWDLVTKKFRIGTQNRYLYFDGNDLYLSSIDLQLTSSELITYNSSRTKRVRYSDIGIYAEQGDNWEINYGKIVFDENPYIDIAKIITKSCFIEDKEFVKVYNNKPLIHKDTQITKYSTNISKTQYSETINSKIYVMHDLLFSPTYLYTQHDSIWISESTNAIFRIGGYIAYNKYYIRIHCRRLNDFSTVDWMNYDRRAIFPYNDFIYYSVYIQDFSNKVVFWIAEWCSQWDSDITSKTYIRIFKITYQNNSFTQQIVQNREITSTNYWGYTIIFPSPDFYNGNESGEIYCGLANTTNNTLDIYKVSNWTSVVSGLSIDYKMINRLDNIKIGQYNRNPIPDIVIGTTLLEKYYFTTSNGNNMGGTILINAQYNQHTISYQNRSNLIYSKYIINKNKNLYIRNNNEKYNIYTDIFGNFIYIFDKYLENIIHFWKWNNEQYASLCDYYLRFYDNWGIDENTCFNFDEGEWISGSIFILDGYQLPKTYIHINKIGNDIYWIDGNSLKLNGTTIYSDTELVSVAQTNNSDVIAVFKANKITYITKQGLILQQEDISIGQDTRFRLYNINALIAGGVRYYWTFNITFNINFYELGGGIIEIGSNTNGTWIKFGDGTMICMGKTATKSGTWYNYPNYGAGHVHSAGEFNVTYPTPFLQPPTVITRAGDISAYGGWWTGQYPDSFNTATGSKWYVWSYTNGNFSSVYVEYFAIGRWKA